MLSVCCAAACRLVYMCGRAVQPSGEELADLLPTMVSIDDSVRSLPARPNLAPSDEAAVLRAMAGPQLLLARVRWGLPKADGRLIFNARSERVAHGMWRNRLPVARVALPVRGFYEWERGSRQPWYIERADGQLLWLAGLWAQGPADRRFVVMTTESSPDLDAVHDRMPVCLHADELPRWLTPAERRDVTLLAPKPGGMLCRIPVERNLANGPKPVSRVAGGQQGNLF